MSMEMVKDEHTADTTITPEQAQAALDHLLAQPDAGQLAEALGLRGYQGHHWRSHSKRAVPVWREGSLT